MDQYGNGNSLTPYIGRRERSSQTSREDQFQNLNATSLYCPKCKAAMPVIERLLLILPDGELYEYKCRRCGTSLGERKVTKKPESFLLR